MLEKEMVSVPTERLAKSLKLELNKELLQIVNYLIDSKKVKVIYSNYLPTLMNGAEELRILPAGVDYLTKLEELEQRDNAEKRQNKITLSICVATIVLAFSSYINLIMSSIELDWKNVFSNMALPSPMIFSLIFSVFLALTGILALLSLVLVLKN